MSSHSLPIFLPAGTPAQITIKRRKRIIKRIMDYPERMALQLVLNFVEDGNKQDANVDVSNAAQELQKFLDEENAKAVSQS